MKPKLCHSSSDIVNVLIPQFKVNERQRVQKTIILQAWKVLWKSK